MTNLLYRGGSCLKFDYPIDSLRYFFRCGTVIPTSRKQEAIGKASMDEYEFLIIPPVHKDLEAFRSIISTHSEDDGESDFCIGSFWRWRMTFEITSTDNIIFIVILTHTAINNEYRKKWRFTVPEGFSIIGDDKKVFGRSVDFQFLEAPKNIRLILRGTYRTTSE